MSEKHWTGPYCSAHGSTGAGLASDPLSNRRPPRDAVKFTVWQLVEGQSPARQQPQRDALPVPAQRS